MESMARDLRHPYIPSTTVLGDVCTCAFVCVCVCVCVCAPLHVCMSVCTTGDGKDREAVGGAECRQRQTDKEAAAGDGYRGGDDATGEGSAGNSSFVVLTN